MPLKNMARRLPEEIWVLFEPILLARIGCGNGRPLKSHRDGFDALRYVWVVGMPWELLPVGFPSHKSIQRRLTVSAGAGGVPSSLAAVGRTVPIVARDPRDQVLLDGAKKPAKKGRTNRAFPVDRAKGTALPLAGDGRPCPWESS